MEWQSGSEGSAMVITLKRPAKCAEPGCGKPVLAGARARWYRDGRVFGIGCHGKALVPMNGRTVAVAEPLDDVLSALKVANVAAHEAYRAYADEHYSNGPLYAVVEHVNQFDDSSPVRKAWGMQDLCGFAYARFGQKANRALVRWFKSVPPESNQYGRSGDLYAREGFEVKIAPKDRWSPGCSFFRSPWEREAGTNHGNGDFGAMCAGVGAFAREMNARGFEVETWSRLD